MKVRDWLTFSTLFLFAVPTALLVYVFWFDGDVENVIYLTVQALRRNEAGFVDNLFIDAGRFLISWWWMMAFVSMALSTLSATFLAATEAGASIGTKAIWVISFYVVGITIPIYCVWQVGARPNQSFKPTSLRDAA